jgi:predicted nicotinamide N-methyase
MNLTAPFFLMNVLFVAVMWPSAVVLSRLLVNEPWVLECGTDNTKSSISILELGAGCGLLGLVAARHHQHHQRKQTKSKSCTVLLTDFNPIVLENLQRNIELNNLTNSCSVAGLDFYQQSGTSTDRWKAMDGTLHDPVDLVLAADVICQPSDAIAVANTIHDVLKPGGIAYVVCADAKHRFGVDHLSSECQRVGLTISTKDVVSNQEKDDSTNDVIHILVDEQQNLEQTTGYVHGMTLTLFIVQK